MSPTSFLGGNLINYSSRWEQITSNPVILQWIRHGAELPFHSEPDEFEEKNKAFNSKEAEFITKEISALLASGCIRESLTKPKCVSKITVVPKKGKDSYRLIIDLQTLNSFCKPKTFKYETIDDATNCITHKDELVTLDIKHGFYHVNVARDFQKYLGFKWLNKYYVFSVLPMGSSCSPYYFCKILRTVIEYLRSTGVKVVAYVDDLIISDSISKIGASSSFVVNTLESLGYFINYEKSDLTPSTSKPYIGYVIHTDKNNTIWLEVPRDRIHRVSHDIRRVLRLGKTSARSLARIAGQLISFSKAIIPTKLFLRSVYRLLKSKQNWQTILYLDNSSRLDLEWWLHSLKSWNGRSAVPCCRPSIQIATDASSLGFGAQIIGRQERAQGLWDHHMSNSASNLRELMAVFMALKSFLHLLRKKNVQIISDNVSAVAYINFQGGPSRQLTEVARDIWGLSVQHGFHIQARYSPGISAEILLPDQLSRYMSKYEWQLHPRVFRYLDFVHGPHSIDRFASMVSTQCQRYNSMYFDPFTEGVDALSQDWTMENNFVNCPLTLLNRVLDLVRDQRATATVIAPMWNAQMWCHRLKTMSTSPPIKLPHPKQICIPLCPSKPEPLKNRKWRLYAWRICGDQN